VLFNTSESLVGVPPDISPCLIPVLTVQLKFVSTDGGVGVGTGGVSGVVELVLVVLLVVLLVVFV
jgi:hypothetical protein